MPEATVARLATYLRVLEHARRACRSTTVSSEELAAAAGVNSAKLRKDLSYLGSYGIRGVGYDVATLTEEIARTLGLTVHRSVALIGVGNLGQALAGYAGFASRGFRDRGAARRRPGPHRARPIGGLVVRDVADLETSSPTDGITIAVLATPAAAAQEVCDRLVAAGVTSILNFAPVVLSVPDHVDVRKVDLAAELQILSFHETPQGVAPDRAASRVGREACDERARRRPVPPHRAGVGARARRASVPTTCRKTARRAAPRGDDQRGAAALHLQPHRGLRRRRPVPPGRRRDQPRCWPATPASTVADLGEHLYVHFAEAAAEHMFSVASGLDSMVVGESQILGQLRSAYALGTEVGTVGTVLHDLAQTALRVGKRVHTDTGIDRAGASVVSVALDQAEQQFWVARRAPRADRRRRFDGRAGRRPRCAAAGVDATSWWPTAASSAAERLAATLGGRAVGLLTELGGRDRRRRPA